MSNIQPGRVLAGYQEAIVRRNTELFDYIRTHRQSGDVVLSSVPSFAPISFGKLDYYLFTPLQDENFDATYWHDSRLIDRWGGGVMPTRTVLHYRHQGIRTLNTPAKCTHFRTLPFICTAVPRNRQLCRTSKTFPRLANR